MFRKIYENSSRLLSLLDSSSTQSSADSHDRNRGKHSNANSRNSSPNRLSLRLRGNSKNSASDDKTKRYKQQDRSALSEALGDIFSQSESLSDLIILAGPEMEEIKVHRAILASQSQVWRNWISQAETLHTEGTSIAECLGGLEELNDENIPTIMLREYDAEVIQKVIAFMYSGNVSISDEDVVEIYLFASQVESVELMQKCEEHISRRIHPDSLPLILKKCGEYQLEDLRNCCIRFFTGNVQSILSSESSLEFSEDDLVELLSKDFYISEELTVFNFVLQWGKYQLRSGSSIIDKRSQTLGRIVERPMSYVRFISIPVDQLERYVSSQSVVKKDMLLSVLFRKLQIGIPHPPADKIESPFAKDPEGNPIKFYLRPRRGQWKILSDFESESTYAEYMKSNLRPGMLVRAVNSYEQITKGDIGEFVQFNTGIPPCQVRWQIYGNTYWLYWKDIEIIA